MIDVTGIGVVVTEISAVELFGLSGLKVNAMRTVPETVGQ